MAVKLKTAAGEVCFNLQTISRVHLSPDHSTITVHFVTGAVFCSPAGTDRERAAVAEFLASLSEERTGFVSSGRELLNLKAALSVTIPEQGPIQVLWQDSRTHSLVDVDADQVRNALMGGAAT